MKLFNLSFILIFLFNGLAKNCIFAQDTLKKCDCKKAVKELMYVESRFVNGDIVFGSKEEYIEYANGTTNSPPPNSHILFLINFTNHKVELTRGCNFYIKEADIEKWKIFISKNCNSIYNKKYHPPKLSNNQPDPSDAKIRVKIKKLN